MDSQVTSRECLSMVENLVSRVDAAGDVLVVGQVTWRCQDGSEHLKDGAEKIGNVVRVFNCQEYLTLLGSILSEYFT